ncbi:thioredoxin domain-containing protein [Candidatus Saccharibacteria bacterium]|nr:thioredoxin domain-containing protein [Candidatus Saccharibacteria bacterium]
MNKFTVGAIIAILIAFGGLFFFASLNSDNKIDYSKYDSHKIIEASEDNGNIADHVRGKADSKIVVVEYADLQCPGCASMMPKMSSLYEKYGDRVAFVFRNYNLSYHQNARAASAAVEAASLQGFFWEMLETAYANQSDWEYITDTAKRTDAFVSLFEQASDGKGDAEKFRGDLTNPSVQKKIDFDIGLGKRVDKIDATPSVFVNGEAVTIDDDAKNQLSDKIDAALREIEPETKE